MPTATNTVEARAARLKRALRKRERKSLSTLAGELGESVKALTVPIAKLIRDESAVRHAPDRQHRSATYTKP